MTLQDLLAGVPVLECHADLHREMTGICYDSRHVAAGQMFVAVVGFAADGHRFIEQAVRAGATVVLCQRKPEIDVEYILVASTRSALAQVSANWFDHPAEKLKMVGVTGTNGKTSVTTILKSVLEQSIGAKVGLIGTVANQIGQTVLPTEHTTPESFELQALLARMVHEGCTHAIMEVSSHALALDRVGGITFDVGVFTNLTEDHLDFHKTMQAYAEAKSILFTRCRTAVMNADDPYYPVMAKAAVCPVVTTGTKPTCDLYAHNVKLLADGVAMEVTGKSATTAFRIGIPGTFTVYNVLSVLGAAMALGVPSKKLPSALSAARGVPGRMEVVPTPGKDFTVLIDYAHTPDALENVLKSVRGFCRGRLLCVFGCGGDRDPLKRPIMGRIGAELADLAIITSDNPRTEDPAEIICQICQGADKTGRHYQVVENRREAIRWAMVHAKKDDIIVLAGKGHETYQIIGKEKTHLDEREEVAKALMQTEGETEHMEQRNLRQAALWCNGTVAPKFENICFVGATMDTRHIQPGQLFVALVGQTRDGHDFARAAIEAGAAAVLAQKPLGEDIPAIYVDDTLRALGDIARVYRQQRPLQVVGITGSVGKTTTKEMTAAVLQTTFTTAKTSANFNNNIGLPLTILGIDNACQTAVLEMGMNHAGEMAYLTGIAKPDVAVITNIGTMHIENLGSRQGILEAKLEILQGLRSGGRVVFNGDEPMLWNLRNSRQLSPVYFGIENSACQVRAYDIQTTEEGVSFGVSGLGQDFHIYLPAEGRHNVYDALAAISVGLIMGVTPARIQEALAEFRNTGMRQRIYDANGFTIIEDCYNAGPESMEAALNVLANHACKGRRIAVLGDMLELGACSGAEHYRIGRLAVGKADIIYTYGKYSDRVVSGAITGGVERRRIGSFTTHEALSEALLRMARPGDVLLFKGSRGMKMENVLKLFLEGTAAKEK